MCEHGVVRCLRHVQVPEDTPVGTVYSIVRTRRTQGELESNVEAGDMPTITVAADTKQGRLRNSKQQQNDDAHAVARSVTHQNLTLAGLLCDDEHGLLPRFAHYADLARIFSAIFRAGLSKYFGK